VIKEPFEDLISSPRSLTRHLAFSADLAIPLKPVDRVVDQVDDILVANVYSGASRIAILDTKCTCAELNKLVHGTGHDGPCSAAGNVGGNDSAVGDLGRATRALVLKCRVTTVVNLEALVQGKCSTEDSSSV